MSDFLGSHRCICSLMKEFDFRAFFGGMSAYHDGAAMARTLVNPVFCFDGLFHVVYLTFFEAGFQGIPNSEAFASNFVYSLNGKADPLMLPSRYILVYLIYDWFSHS